jgi:hypothetical protein
MRFDESLRCSDCLDAAVDPAAVDADGDGIVEGGGAVSE